jgi:hypothetical protein
LSLPTAYPNRSFPSHKNRGLTHVHYEKSRYQGLNNVRLKLDHEARRDLFGSDWCLRHGFSD